MPSALPGADNFRLASHHLLCRPGTHSQTRSKFLEKRCRRTFSIGDIDTKIDQPQSAIAFDHDKVAAMGLDMQ
jgi:hypothetical protein